MRCLHYPICIASNWCPSLDTGLRDIFTIVTMALWPCPCHFYTYWKAIHWLRIAVSKSLPNNLIFKTKNCGGSTDPWGLAALTQTILPIQAANTLIVGEFLSTALGLYKMQHPKSVTLCWCSFSDCSCDHVAFSFAPNGCQYVDYGLML